MHWKIKALGPRSGELDAKTKKADGNGGSLKDDITVSSCLRRVMGFGLEIQTLFYT